MKKARIKCRVKGTRLYVEAFSSSIGPSGIAYDAAGHGRRAKSWHASSAGPNAVLSYGLPTLRNRSRDAVRKNGFADQIISVHETNLIGTGVRPQFRTSDNGLNRELAELWDDWIEESDADGILPFYGQQALMVRAMAEGGEVFGRFRVRRPGDMVTVPLQIQLLEPEYVPLDSFSAIVNRDIRHGIEFDARGVRVAYWMYKNHPNDLAILARSSADLTPKRIGASEVMHVYECRRPGAIRGEPWLTRALIKLRDLDKYDDAELMRKQVASLFAGFITRPEPGEEGFEGDGTGSRLTVEADGSADVVFEPGMLATLEPGEEVTFSNPSEVGNSYAPFMTQQMRAVAVAGRILYEQATGDYSKVNDRTFRASVNEFRRWAGKVQASIVVHQFCRPTVERWRDLAVLAGMIDRPAAMEDRDFARVKWVSQGWSYIHPVQEVDAQLKEIEGMLRPRSDVIVQRGDNPETVDEQIAADKEREEELGIKATPATPPPGRPPMTPDEEDDAADAADAADNQEEDRAVA